jgi:Domain of unknown function (DUF6285)
VQFPPAAPELLAAIGRLLDEHVVAAVPAHLQHQVRVAANLSGIVERELRLGPGNDARERELIVGLLGEEVDDPPAALADRLRDVGDPDFESRAWAVLVEIARGDLAVAKPGHDSWDGE